MMGSKLWTCCCLILLGISMSWTQEVNNKAPSEIANIAMIDDVSAILNYNDLRQKKGFLLGLSNNDVMDSGGKRSEQAAPSEIVNIAMIADVSVILKYNDLRQRKVFFTRDCEELYLLGHRKNGVYVIRPEGSPYLVVQCYMYDCGGWTVIQRNSFNTEITWSGSWTDYQYGFGNIELDHYLGNHYIHLLTVQKWNKVRVVLVDAKNRTRRADYDSFYLTNATDKFRVRLGTYDGDAGDSLSSGDLKNLHDNMRFSTYDDDNDRLYNQNCANEHGGGWWYDSCYDAQLNKNGGLHWKTLCDHNCRNSLILIKPVHMYCNRA